jgi:transcriptional repressor NrdR
MKCPYCGFADQKVLDSRVAREGDAIRRRRECLSCGRRFTTYEEPERPRLYVVKRSGAREEFDREKMLKSMFIACGKRPVTVETVRDAAARIEHDCFQDFEDEVRSSEIGEHVMKELMGIDTVAYIRFASVYKEFATISDFARIVETVNTVSIS